MQAFRTAERPSTVTTMRRSPTTLAALAAACLLLASAGSAQAAAPGPAAGRGAQVAPGFSGQAMWIWVLDRTEGGDPARIAARARAAGVETVFVKSGDGASLWRQFTRPLVTALKAQGLRVCAWQFIYGRRPAAEARVGAASVARGADCLIADAETSYEGRYASAATYLRVLRARIGAAFPLAMTSFPYVDLHPSFPYSVFLGPGGAQVNMPQVYWKDIGDRVDRSLARTVQLNRVYARPIHPVGQLYQAPSTTEVLQFGRLAAAYAVPGLSWWEWTFASPRLWNALPRTRPGRVPVASVDPGWPLLRRGAAGDLVLRARALLRGKGLQVTAGGRFDAALAAALRSFQLTAGLPPTGTLDAATWPALLGLPGAAPAPAAPSPTGGASAR
jgi:peptidoglycan hydrolase-like protein with peptidoglycan-binding domain